MPVSYTTGTVSLANGSSNVAGVGTLWISAGVQPGDIFEAKGFTFEIATVPTNTSITLIKPWTDVSLSGNIYSVRFVPQATRVLTQVNTLLAQLANGILSGLSAIASPAADKLAYLTGASTWGLVDFKAWARSFIGAANAGAAQTALGLGSMATQANTAVNIDGGAIDGTPIGASASSTGKFTTLTATGQLIGGLGSITSAGTLDWNDASNARSGSGYSLMRSLTAINGPPAGSSDSYHPLGFEYSTKDGSGNMTQFAIPYSVGTTAQGLYYRTRFSGTWSTWRKIVANDAAGNYGFGTDSPTAKVHVIGGVTISGALSKGSGSFRIDHPLPALSKTHDLVHSFVEAPTADNIYRGKVKLVAGVASVNIDAAAGMTEGTFTALNGNLQVMLQNNTGWTPVKGRVTGNMLMITAQNLTATDEISWLVIGERQDKHMLETQWTDEFGRVTVEPLKTIPEPQPEPTPEPETPEVTQ